MCFLNIEQGGAEALQADSNPPPPQDVSLLHKGFYCLSVFLINRYANFKCQHKSCLGGPSTEEIMWKVSVELVRFCTWDMEQERLRNTGLQHLIMTHHLCTWNKCHDMRRNIGTLCKLEAVRQTK
jgi:hypothetical protein